MTDRAPPADDRTARVERWQTAIRIAALLAVDPVALGGVVVHAGPGPARDRWLDLYGRLVEPGATLLRMHPTIPDDRLVGGLDLAGTLATGRAVYEPGLLARADGRTVVLSSAQLLTAATAARIGAAMDTGRVALLREGADLKLPSRFGVVALDESGDADERLPTGLSDRLAFQLDLDGLALADLTDVVIAPARIAEARRAAAVLAVPDPVIAAICEAAAAFGIDAPRAVILAVRVARTIASLDGASEIGDEAAVEAARLVLGPRARQLPAPADAETEPPVPPEQDSAPPPETGETETQLASGALADMMVDAVQAVIPANLLEPLATAAPSRSGSAGHAGGRRRSLQRGQQIGTIYGEPRGGARIDLLATLRAAVPWQRLRRRDGRRDPGFVISRSDFRIKRYEEPSRTLTIFAVDASGSAALHRLGEAKGAVALLLADCYVRRDSVALITFRGSRSELMLPPTRSLARAKRTLAGLPGGGGTPLAHALAAAGALGADAVRRGQTPGIVLLTDCRANIALDGSGGRGRAEEDALRAARGLGRSRTQVLLIDTAPRPQPFARDLQAAMGAAYLALPYSDSRSIAGAARAFVQAPVVRRIT